MGVMEMFRLDGKVVIVTGASSGLGVAFAHCFAEAGADVVLGARRIDRLDETRRLVEDAGRRAVAVRTDVADPDDCRRLVDAAMLELDRRLREGNQSSVWCAAYEWSKTITGHSVVVRGFVQCKHLQLLLEVG